jgi:hypothetical protein
VKARIAVYGTSDVIRALARFEESGAVLSDGPASRALSLSFRLCVPISEDISDHELELLLLGAPPGKAAPNVRPQTDATSSPSLIPMNGPVCAALQTVSDSRTTGNVFDYKQTGVSASTLRRGF